MAEIIGGHLNKSSRSQFERLVQTSLRPNLKPNVRLTDIHAFSFRPLQMRENNLLHPHLSTRSCRISANYYLQ